jgi:FG-GAP repeat
MRRVIILLALVLPLWPFGHVPAAAAAPSPRAILPPDFDGDGFADLAVGVPDEDIGAASGAGAVNVLYGTASGLSSAGNQFWNQDSQGIQDLSEDGDSFGEALAAGDFDGDGFTDLAIGVPNEDLGAATTTGAVTVIYGSASGLTLAGNQFWAQDSTGIADQSEIGDHFGQALAAGDFDGDGFVDLAVGVPDEDLGSILDAGSVNVLFGSASGLSFVGNQFWNQSSPGIIESAQTSDNFGDALAAGDFDGDRFDDLAVGVPNDDVGPVLRAGVVNLIYGSTSGLTSAGNQVWSQDTSGVLDAAEGVDAFGTALATGDFDGDGFNDLAIGVPDEDLGPITSAGSVNVLYGTFSGLSAAGNQFWNQSSPGIVESADLFDAFGETLATGDLDGDGFFDLAVGVPEEDVGTISGAGSVNAIYGSASGLNSAGNQVWSQDTPGVLDASETADTFSAGLAAADFDGDAFADLAAGVPSEDVGAATGTGAVNAVFGSASGLTSAGNEFWSQDSPGIADVAEDFDSFGSPLTG